MAEKTQASFEAVAKARFVRCSPRKVRQVADQIRAKSVDHAISLLFTLKKHKKGAELLDKVLQSAVANFREVHREQGIDTNQLKVASILVDQGPVYKRIRARAQGRAYRILKPLCHITVQVKV